MPTYVSVRGRVVGVRIHIDCGFKADAQTLQTLVRGQEVATGEDVDERVALQTAQPIHVRTYTRRGAAGYINDSCARCHMH